MNVIARKPGGGAVVDLNADELRVVTAVLAHVAELASTVDGNLRVDLKLTVLQPTPVESVRVTLGSDGVPMKRKDGGR